MEIRKTINLRRDESPVFTPTDFGPLRSALFTPWAFVQPMKIQYYMDSETGKIETAPARCPVTLDCYYSIFYNDRTEPIRNDSGEVPGALFQTAIRIHVNYSACLN